MIEMGVALKAVSEILGHTSVSFILDRYTNAQIGYLKLQILLFDDGKQLPVEMIDGKATQSQLSFFTNRDFVKFVHVG